MDLFAQEVARAAGRPADSFGAVYHETAEAGLARLAKDDAPMAMVPLPFASDLEVVTKSKPLPSGFLCLVDSRLPAPEADKLIKALLHLHQTDSGREILKTMKMTRFKDLDQPALDAIRRSAAGSK